ncbi:hypothetical protein [Sphingobium nicotianae]|uniref:Glycosyltransferase RgtA/B/C/D-like domain-containing protein n=1 Tax=Sphingobium nicotianae TaxID=2782607 RepID=A0A9X1IT44_9SPHN|nr:hypothetical protein [Sphingobium nicotianae]MBT2189208.1 hypothetical protein [Sphingobium nicotianae]
MLHGALPYVDMFDRKPIGLFLIYAGARLLPGDGFLAYKLVALAFLAATALGVFHLARRRTGMFGATVAACLFVLWHQFMGGEGGQSPVFYDLFMVGAAMLVVRAIDRPGDVRRLGTAAMLAIGLAIEIKPCVAAEGIYFGCALLWIAHRQGASAGSLALSASLWIGAAMLPTALVFGAYAAMGHADAFLFCNVLSAMAQERNPLGVQLRDLAEIIAILSPLGILLAFGHARGMIPPADAATRFVQGWFLVCLLAVLGYFRFNSPHYAIPLLLPICVLLAPLFDAPPRRERVTLALVGLSFVMSQIVLRDHEARRGGGAEAALAAAAARPAPGRCIFVYSGYPALYMLTHSCLPSRWAFPGSLDMHDERNPAAIGVDPAREVARIMASRPAVVVDEWPHSRFGNAATQAVVDRALRRDYALATCLPLGDGRTQLFYRPRGEGRAIRRPANCPV